MDWTRRPWSVLAAAAATGVSCTSAGPKPKVQIVRTSEYGQQLFSIVRKIFTDAGLEAARALKALALPGVEAVGSARDAPMDRKDWTSDFRPSKYKRTATKPRVKPGYWLNCSSPEIFFDKIRLQKLPKCYVYKIYPS